MRSSGIAAFPRRRNVVSVLPANRAKGRESESQSGLELLFSRPFAPFAGTSVFESAWPEILRVVRKFYTFVVQINTLRIIRKIRDIRGQNATGATAGPSADFFVSRDDHTFHIGFRIASMMALLSSSPRPNASARSNSRRCVSASGRLNPTADAACSIRRTSFRCCESLA